jgi:TonB family protein
MPLNSRLLLLFCALGSFGFAQSANTGQAGFIYCAKERSELSAPVFLSACKTHQLGTLPCGRQIEVIAQMGQVSKVRTSAGSTVFVDSVRVSQKAEQFIPVAIEAESAPDCNVKVPEPPDFSSNKNRPPHVVSKYEPDYPATAPRTSKETVVTLALVVGVDGQPHNIRIESSPGKDFSKNAIEAVSKWKFDPGLKNGQPVEMPVSIEMSFRLIR